MKFEVKRVKYWCFWEIDHIVIGIVVEEAEVDGEER
jgi:hypothetical protein